MPEPFLTTVSRTKNDTLQLLSAIQHSPLHAVSSPCICWLLVACFAHVHGASHNVSSRWTKWEGRWMRGKSGQRASKALEPIREGRLRVVRTSLQFYIPFVRKGGRKKGDAVLRERFLRNLPRDITKHAASAPAPRRGLRNHFPFSLYAISVRASLTRLLLLTRIKQKPFKYIVNEKTSLSM